MKTKILLGVALLVLAGAFIYFKFYNDKTSTEPDPAAKWLSGESGGTSFRYPESLDFNYVELLDWPPQVQILKEPLTCVNAGKAIERAGRTEERNINGRKYCVTEVQEGAAGSIYTSYAYAFSKGDDTAILTFSTRAVQCGNYDEPEKSACQTEQSILNIDEFAEGVARTIK